MNMVDIQAEVRNLINQHGEESIIKAVTVLTDRAGRPIPAEHIEALGALSVKATISQLDTATADILNQEALNEAQFETRKQLLREKSQLETSVQLTEAEALMMIRGSGKDAYVEIAGEKTAITNDQARDAYRRMSSKTDRIRLAEVEGELAAIDAEIARIKEAWDQKKEAYNNVRAKANVQAALLTFLA